MRTPTHHVVAVLSHLAICALAVAMTWCWGTAAAFARPATDEERAALATVVGMPPACVVAVISDNDPSYATIRPTNVDPCPKADGVTVARLVSGVWNQVTAGSDFGYCPVTDVPDAVAAEFQLCRQATPADTVLGGLEFAGDHGDGFGEPRPRRVYNGGVPSGLVSKVRWRDWGARVSRGSGRFWIYRPEGGYYPHTVSGQFRASRLGRCTEGGPPAYTRLQFRVPSKPGGKLGGWTNWSGVSSICSWDA